MCGISTVYRYNDLTEEDKRKLHSMNEEMVYRGPDDRESGLTDIVVWPWFGYPLLGLRKANSPFSTKIIHSSISATGDLQLY